MKYLFDIGHPAHVHYFKNVIEKLLENHSIKITARDKEVSLDLLKKYNFPYVLTGVNKSSFLSKGFALIKNDYIIYKEAKQFNPDLLISFFLPFTAHIGKILRIPVIGFTDTEGAILNILLSERFTDVIITPKCYHREISVFKHVKFDGYFELSYLHPKYYIPDESVLKYLKLRKNDKYVILRFISWKASHDIGHKGIDLRNKINIVNELSKYARIFISSESDLPSELQKYKLTIPPEKMHHVQYYAHLLYGESTTMASECAMLGTPAIYINDVEAGVLKEQEEYGLIRGFKETEQDINNSLSFAVELLHMPNLKEEWQKRRQKMLEDKIDVAAFMVWFIENYPESANIIKENPDYQYKFR